MSKQSTQADIQACVESFVTELTALIQKSTIESVLNAVSGTVGAPPARRGRPRKSASTAKPAAAPKAKRASTKKRGRRTSADVTRMTTDALAHIASNPGCSVSEIGAALGASTKELRLPLMKLGENKKIRTVGQKRGTRYHAGAARKTKARKTSARKTKARGKKR